MSDPWGDLLKLGAEQAQAFYAQCDEDERVSREDHRIASLKGQLRKSEFDKEKLQERLAYMTDLAHIRSKSSLDKTLIAEEYAKKSFESTKDSLASTKLALAAKMEALESSKEALASELEGLEIAKMALAHQENSNLIRTDLNIVRSSFLQQMMLHVNHLLARQAVCTNILEKFASNAGMNESELSDLRQAIVTASDKVYRSNDLNGLNQAFYKDLIDLDKSRLTPYQYIEQIGKINPENRKMMKDKIEPQRTSEINAVILAHLQKSYGIHDWMGTSIAGNAATPSDAEKISRERVQEICETIYYPMNLGKTLEKFTSAKMDKLEKDLKETQEENTRSAKFVKLLTRDLAHHMAQSSAFRQQLTLAQPDNPLITDPLLRQRVAHAAYEQLAQTDFCDWDVVREVGSTFMEKMDEDSS